MTTSDQLLVVPDEETVELIDEGRRLAELLGRTGGDDVNVVAVAFEGLLEPDQAAALRPDEVLAVSRECGPFRNGAAGVTTRVTTLESLVEEREPDAVLLPSTPDGDAVATRLAARVRGGGLVNCLLQVREGSVTGGQRVYDGRAFAEYDFERSPVVASLALEGLSTPDARPDTPPVRTDRTVAIEDQRGLDCLEVIAVPEDDLERAQRVVAGGYGLEGPEGFEVVGDLADALEASLGASRPPVDDGWMPYEKQIGVTGKEVDADLYVPCAISGDPYHMGGVEADAVIPINSDAEARIFEFADLGIVGDVYEYAPIIAEAIRDARGSATADDEPETAVESTEGGA